MSSIWFYLLSFTSKESLLSRSIIISWGLENETTEVGWLAYYKVWGVISSLFLFFVLFSGVKLRKPIFEQKPIFCQLALPTFNPNQNVRRHDHSLSGTVWATKHVSKHCFPFWDQYKHSNHLRKTIITRTKKLKKIKKFERLLQCFILYDTYLRFYPPPERETIQA
jgi:Na+/melibiose symporter-like transporter